MVNPERNEATEKGAALGTALGIAPLFRGHTTRSNPPSDPPFLGARLICSGVGPRIQISPPASGARASESPQKKAPLGFHVTHQ